MVQKAISILFGQKRPLDKKKYRRNVQLMNSGYWNLSIYALVIISYSPIKLGSSPIALSGLLSPFCFFISVSIFSWSSLLCSANLLSSVSMVFSILLFSTLLSGFQLLCFYGLLTSLLCSALRVPTSLFLWSSLLFSTLLSGSPLFWFYLRISTLLLLWSSLPWSYEHSRCLER